MTETTASFQFGKYDRDRPFLVITMIGRPAKHVKTEQAGWADESRNWDVYEQPAMVDRVSAKHLSEASVIIDCLNSRVVKNRYRNADDEKILEHYMGKYSSEIAEGIQIWTKQIGLAAAEKEAAE